MDKKTVSELKKILTDRGIPCNGKLRAELVTLAQKAVKLYREREGCDHELSERKRRCVVVEDGTGSCNVEKLSHNAMRVFRIFPGSRQNRYLG